jgi:hypothetical protein
MPSKKKTEPASNSLTEKQKKKRHQELSEIQDMIMVAYPIVSFQEYRKGCANIFSMKNNYTELKPRP